jgi:hypothetical protein
MKKKKSDLILIGDLHCAPSVDIETTLMPLVSHYGSKMDMSILSSHCDSDDLVSRDHLDNDYSYPNSTKK